MDQENQYASQNTCPSERTPLSKSKARAQPAPKLETTILHVDGIGDTTTRGNVECELIQLQVHANELSLCARHDGVSNSHGCRWTDVLIHRSTVAFVVLGPPGCDLRDD